MNADKELMIQWEWEPAESIRTPEHRATMARITIKIGSSFVTLVEDRASGSSRRSIYCPLYPLAEWVVYNWWFLQANSRPARFIQQDAIDRKSASRLLPRPIWEHHSTRASGDGFAWPDLLIIPDGESTRMVWDDDWDTSRANPVRFLSRGDVRVNSDLVKAELAVLVTETITRLSEQGITDTILEREWAAIRKTDPDEADYCVAAAQLGLDPYSDAESYEQDILEAAEALSGPLLYDFLNAVDPASIASCLKWIANARRTFGSEELAGRPQVRAYLPSTHRDTMKDLRMSVERTEGWAGKLPWDVGYRHARTVRKSLELDSHARFEIDHYVSTIKRQSPDPSLQALGSATGTPLLIVGQRRPTVSNRFTLSRALWHYIWDDAPLFVVTAAHAHRQSVERAFAAELLAPASGIAQLLESPPEAVSQEELDQVAQHYGVASLVVEHQVRNHLVRAA